MAHVAVLGVVFGDEGKGGIEAFVLKNGTYLPAGARYSAVVRYNGGANAGESYEHFRQPGRIVVSHQVPVGMGLPGLRTAVLAGFVVHPLKLVEEIWDGYAVRTPAGDRREPGLVEQGIAVTPETFSVSGRAQVTLLHHLAREARTERGSGGFNTTNTGIAPTYADAAEKIGMTFAEFVGPNFEAVLAERVLPAVRERFPKLELEPAERYLETYADARRRLAPFLRSEASLQELGGNILIAGAQSVGLDVLVGANRYSTSSSVTRLPFEVERRIGVLKMVQSDVGDRRATGNRKWLTYDQELTKGLRGENDDDGMEVGKTSGRQRNLGFLDGVLTRHSITVGRVGLLAATKLDEMEKVLKLTNGKVRVATAYRYKGALLEEFPDDSWVLEGCEPVYEEFAVGEDVRAGKRLRELRGFSELSQGTRDLFNRLGDYLGAPFEILSTGPWTDNKIVR